MGGISAVTSSVATMTSATRGGAPSEEARESQGERAKEARQGEEAAKPVSPPTATAGNSVNVLA